ncbi:MAG TPA: hypothetical protein VGC82_03410 [Rhodopila sp.]
MLDQVPQKARTRAETALQTDDVPNALGFRQGQQLFGFGGGGRERPLAINVLARRDHDPGEPRMIESRGQDHDEINIRAINQRPLVTEGVRDAERARDRIRSCLRPACDRNDLELLKRLQCGDVAVSCPAARPDDAHPDSFTAHCHILDQLPRAPGR